MIRALVVWLGADELKPYPWATVPCDGCGERELAVHMSGPTWFVCMACGNVQEIATMTEDTQVGNQPCE